MDICNLNKLLKYIALLCLMSVLAACGGGSGSGTSDTGIDNTDDDSSGSNTNICRGEISNNSASDAAGAVGDILTGHFSNSIVSGLAYSTATQSGITDADGSFQYQSGELITFSVGGVVLGEAVTAKAEMTPFDLVKEATLCTTNRQVEKLLRLPIDDPERKAFNIFANTLIFLQTLDDDNNPDNGIDIPAEMPAMFEGVNLNFELDFRDFADREKNAALRKVTNLAANNGFLAYGGIRKPGKALGHFYTAQQIQSAFVVAAEDFVEPYYEYVDDDGRYRYFLSSSSFTYDDNGNLLDTNSKPSPSGSYTYDNNGNLLSASTFVSFHSGTNTFEYTYTVAGDPLSRYHAFSSPAGLLESTSVYDAERKLQSTLSDSYGVLSETTYTYNSAGKLLTVITLSDSDGIARSETYTYNTVGAPLSAITVNPDGSSHSIKYSYDSNNRLLGEVTEFRDSNGTLERGNADTYTYDGEIQTKLHERIFSDGSYRLEYTETYNADGHLLSSSRILYSSSGISGKHEGVYVYDVDGNLLSYISKGIDSEGTVNRVDTETYTYDSSGKLLKSNVESNIAGIPDIISIDTYTYHANGKLSKKESVTDYDYNRNGLVDLKVTKTDIYDIDGYRLSETVIESAYDGSEQRSEKNYNYDSNGNLMSISDDSGVIESYTLISTDWFGFLRAYENRRWFNHIFHDGDKFWPPLIIKE